MSADVIPFRRALAAPASTLEIEFADYVSDEHVRIARADHASRVADRSNPNPCTLELSCLLASVDGMARYLRDAVPGLNDAGVEHYLTTALAYYTSRKLGGRE
jgi:hypothetical protein